MGETQYPAEPWRLSATLLGSVFLVPEKRLPRSLFAAMPDRCRPLWLGRHALVATAFVDYCPPGDLTYNELLVAVLGWRDGRVVTTIGDIWVDSPESRAGGRELWRIPKELGDFERYAGARSVFTSLTAGGSPVASLAGRPGSRLAPLKVPVPLITAQRLEGRTAITRSRLVGPVRRLKTDWSFNPRGPLGNLSGARPLFSVAMTYADVTFGTSGGNHDQQP